MTPIDFFLRGYLKILNQEEIYQWIVSLCKCCKHSNNISVNTAVRSLMIDNLECTAKVENLGFMRQHEVVYWMAFYIFVYNRIKRNHSLFCGKYDSELFFSVVLILTSAINIFVK